MTVGRATPLAATVRCRMRTTMRKRRSRRSPRRAFTVVEVLLSMGLTALLMAGLMSIASATAADQARVEQRHSNAEPAWVGPLARQLETDLLMGVGVSGVIPSSSRGIEGGQRMYVLTQNVLSQDEATPHQVVLVEYRLTPPEEGGVLLRSETPLTHPQGMARTTRDQSSIQLMAVGIDRLTLGGATLGITPHAQTPDRDTSGGMPAAFTVLVAGRPIQMLPISSQTQFSITPSMVTETDDRRSIPIQPTYERHLITR